MTPNQWTRSSRCANGACTLVRHTADGTVQVADSKLGDNSPVLTFDPAVWAAFLDTIKAGQCAT